MNVPQEIRFPGCSPVPLAMYLKALGILRLVAGRLDTAAKGYWDGDTFCLKTIASEQELLDFFEDRYVPTPIVAPWNGGSGFYGSGSSHAVVERLSHATAPRLQLYRAAISGVRSILNRLDISEKPKDDMKAQLLIHCRNELADEVVEWLDAVAMLTRDDPKFPPLLGTGGNDGNLEFTNNFMQNVLRLIGTTDGMASEDSHRYLTASLFSIPVANLVPAAIGQFSPGQAGGPNSTTGFSGDSIINPWDFVLMIEGTIVFAATATRKNQSVREPILSYPFTVRPSGGGSGSTSSADGDTSHARAEMWLPIWHQPTGFQELSHLFREGRVQLKSSPGRGRKSYRSPENGIDFARACASLGVDRGIDSFVRYAFLIRSGKSYLSVPLTRFRVRRRTDVDLLTELDSWLVGLKRYCNAKEAPESFKQALYGIEQAMFRVAEFAGAHHVRHLLLQLSRIERLCVHSVHAREFIRPLVLQNPEWLYTATDNSSAWAIALSIASLRDVHGTIPLRAYMSPINPDDRRVAQWIDERSSSRVVFGTGDVTQSLARVLERRLLDWRQGNKKQIEVEASQEAQSPRSIDTPRPRNQQDDAKPFASSLGVHLEHIQEFVYGSPDLRRQVGEYLWAMLPFTINRVIHEHASDLQATIDASVPLRSVQPLPWAYEMSKLVVTPDEVWSRKSRTRGGVPVASDEVTMPIPGSLVNLLVSGQVDEAVRVAQRRLTASGMKPKFQSLQTFDVTGLDCVAALLIPLSYRALRELRRKLIESPQTDNYTTQLSEGE